MLPPTSEVRYPTASLSRLQQARSAASGEARGQDVLILNTRLGNEEDQKNIKELLQVEISGTAGDSTSASASALASGANSASGEQGPRSWFAASPRARSAALRRRGPSPHASARPDATSGPAAPLALPSAASDLASAPGSGLGFFRGGITRGTPYFLHISQFRFLGGRPESHKRNPKSISLAAFCTDADAASGSGARASTPPPPLASDTDPHASGGLGFFHGGITRGTPYFLDISRFRFLGSPTESPN
ncbi:hypothetical protein NL676_007206 [Syzygium grande]|nr:hypothetical protein NL676_007206 [Syzygium grande]